jgi:hypothetical protein
VPEVPATRFLSGLAPAAAAPGWTSSPASASPPAARAPTRGTTRSQGPGEFGRR